MNVIAYTDGSASVKGEKLGGYGIYITYEENDEIIREKCFHEGFKNTKTGRMELMGAINCLKNIPEKDLKVTVYCDSIYAVNCVKERRLWKWRRTNYTGLKNIDLLIIFLDEVEKFKYVPVFKHIKGHSKKEDQHSLGNEIADKLANYKQFKQYKQDLS